MVDERIGLVQGDDLPFIRLQFSDGQTGAALNLSDPEVIVSVRFRAHRQAEVLFSTICEKVDGVRFNFAPDLLDVPAGLYEAEVEIDFEGQKQTIYDPIRFVVREAF
ncbi:MAG: hypothetical protein EBS61_09985 [Betaproteobacteria bacterium]|nr:hypothetical protein [Betaproteobacteria bacterium]